MHLVRIRSADLGLFELDLDLLHFLLSRLLLSIILTFMLDRAVSP